MLERVAGLASLVVVVGLPFLLRPRENLLDREGEALVVITPHHEAIRYEFGRAFRVYMREKKGRSVHVDWRTPGGTNEIARYVASEYAAAFEIYWNNLGHRFTPIVASAFSNPQIRWTEPGPDETEKLARRTFLESNVGIGIDLMFGSGGNTFVRHAASGWFVDSGFVKDHPELANDAVLPETIGSTRFWDHEGRWIGTCLSSFGICFNKSVLERLGVRGVPESWRDLADPAYAGQLALADPTKSGSVATAFEMLVQEQMNLRAAELESREGATSADVEARAPREGWDRAMRLIRRLGGNARYFTDAAPKIAIDVATGDAAAGMCIDFYGRFQSESTAHGGPSRIGFVMPRGGTSIDADAIALMRGAPHRELAREFIDFVLSREGQKLWNFKVGAPGGPERYALRRLPVLPELYAPEYDTFRSDPGEHPFEQARAFVYHPGWTGPLLRSLSFVVRVMCVDTEHDLSEAYRALFSHGFPPRATAAFDDVELVGYAAATGPIRAALGSGNPLDEVALGNRLVGALRAQYRAVVDLARSGQ
jgi:ABC-type Fe3+ transport system substrate-binding protein